MTTKVLTRRQARWAEFLSEFDFTITYSPGPLNTLPDVLSRRDNVYPAGGIPYAEKNAGKIKQILKQYDIQPSNFFLC